MNDIRERAYQYYIKKLEKDVKEKDEMISELNEAALVFLQNVLVHNTEKQLKDFLAFRKKQYKSLDPSFEYWDYELFAE